MVSNILCVNIELIAKTLGNQSPVIVKKFYIGKMQPINAAVIYINGLADKDSIEKNLLKPLMFYLDEKLECNNICDYLCKKYILISNTWIERDLNSIVAMIKKGNAAVLIDGVNDVIILDTADGEYRSIDEPPNESSIRGTREGFVENLDINISILRRKIKDSNLIIENYVVGRRSQSEVALVYISDIADPDVVNEVRKRITDIDIDIVTGSGIIEQCIENYTYSFFPQSRGSERPDIVANNLTEGRIAILLNGTPFIIMVPCMFTDFFQTVEDYYGRTIVSNFSRVIRMFAVFVVVTFPSIFLTLVKFNAELIPVKFITPIIQSRTGIALTPFLEILSMEIIVEFLREGGLRLPSKIGQTLSVVGGIIIGNTAVESKIVSPSTLFVVGVTVIATFLIPNYDMALSLRVIRFPMLILANFLGIFGIGIGWFIILVHLSSLDSFGVPYLSFNLSDMKDTLIRAPLWKMDKRPETTANGNMIRQTDFRKKWGLPKRKKDEESGE